MANLFSQLLQQAATGDYLRDYQHASRTFVDSLYRLNPKTSALFHVYIDVNPDANQNRPTEIGLLAKSVSLPKFTVQNKIINAYNRKNIIQERINYDPVTLMFHDDNANVIRDFWINYYSYYYRDADHEESMYLSEHKYQNRPTQSWGYSPLNSTDEGSTVPYINAIRIYSLHQQSYSSYTLIRPTITSFAHGQHQAGEYNPLEQTITISYETALYGSGAVSNGTVMGFGELHYDKTPSPLSAAGGGTFSVFGAGGIIAGGQNVLNNLESGNYVGAALGALRLKNNIKHTNIKQAATAEFTQVAKDLIRSQNSQSSIFVPVAGAVNTAAAKAVQAIQGLNKNSSSTNNINSQNDPNTNSPLGRIDL